MDSLLKIEQAFYTKDYETVLAQPATDERVELLQLRALIASGKVGDARARLEDPSTPPLKAMKAYAMQSDAELSQLAQDESDATKHLVALTYASLNNLQEALNVLKNTGKNLDCCLLKTHILLTLNQVKEAQNVVDQTRSWANDHIIFNICEALVSLRNGASQKAFFIYEENQSLTQSKASSLGMAVAELSLKRFPEASESIKNSDLTSEAALTSSLALNVIQGNETDATTCRSELKKTNLSNSHYAVDLKEKEDLFNQLVEKFTKA